MPAPENTKPAPVPVVNYREKARESYAANQPKPEAKVETKPAEPAPTEVKPEVKVEVKPEVKVEEKKAAPSDTIAKSFEKLAVEREALRKERTEFEAKQKEIEALQAAIKNRDPRAILALAGLTHADYVASYTGKELPPEEGEESKVEEKKAPQASSEVAELKERLDALQADLQKEHMEKTQRQVVDAFVSHFKSLESEFPLSSKFGEQSVTDALRVMNDHFARTGKHISEDPIESFRAAMAAVEEGHQATVRKYGLLTSEKAPAKVAGQSEASGSPRSESVALTNGDGSAPLAPKTQPVKPEDYRARAREAYRKHAPTP